MRKLIVLALCLIGAFSLDAQTPFSIGGTSPAASPFTYDDGYGDVTIGIGTLSAGGQVGSALIATNYAYIQSTNPYLGTSGYSLPQSISSIINFTGIWRSPTIPSSGSTPVSFQVGRTDPTFTYGVADFTLDQDGLCGIGAPATAYSVGSITGVHLFVTDPFPYNSGTSRPLMLVATNAGDPSLFVSATGNVGIGTVVPGQALQVVGTTSTTDFQMTDGAANDYVLQSDASGNASWVDPNTVAGAGLWAKSGNNIYNTNTANVGVGTSSPLSTLTVSTTNNASLTPQSGIEIDNSYSFLDASGAFTPFSFSIKRSIRHLFSTDTYTDMVVNSSGYVGIGTATPSQPLDVVGIGLFENNLNVEGNLFTNGNNWTVGTLTNDGNASFTSNVTVNGVLKIPTGATANYILQSDASGNASWVNPTSLGAGLWALSGNNIYNTNTASVFINGKTSIGTNASTLAQPPGYSLYVDSGILAESFKVAPSSSADWFDMVFDSSYALRPISEVEQYVRLNHHLPDIPSADDVAKNGIDVAKMDGRLLEKIEELTLYVIQLKSEVEKLKTAKK